MSEREHFTNGRTFSFATGIALVALAFGAYLSGWTHWVTLGAVYASGSILMLFAGARIAKSYFSSPPNGSASTPNLTVTPLPELPPPSAASLCKVGPDQIADHKACLQLGMRINQALTPLQLDAMTLSMNLISFIEDQGPQPTPKYTLAEIHAMSSDQSRALIEGKDKDYDFSCEYHHGTLRGDGPYTASEIQTFTMARFMLLDPWYSKIKASYELRFRTEVETMRNRFAVEGLVEDLLRVPVEGKMGRESIRAIAAKLWELAYEVRVR